MKTIKHIIISHIILVLPYAKLYSQDNRTLDTKVADLLVQVPANNQKELNRQMNLMLKLGDEGLHKILDMVIPPGTGDDTNPRNAIESLSRFLGKSGKEEQKGNWENMLLLEINNRVDTDVKSFFISQLNYIGGDATIEGLSKYLNDDRLHDPAIRAMRDANREAAAKVFAENITKTSGMKQIALVNAIAETGRI